MVWWPLNRPSLEEVEAVVMTNLVYQYMCGVCQKQAPGSIPESNSLCVVHRCLSHMDGMA